MPGLTETSLTNDRMNALDSVRSLVFRYSLMSRAKSVIVSILSRVTLRFDRTARASSAAASSLSLRSRCSLMRSEASDISMSVVSMACQILPSRFFTSSSSSSMTFSFLRCSRATPSISSSTILTRSRILLSVRMLSRMLETIRPSKFLELSLGVWQVPLPFLSREWQT